MTAISSLNALTVASLTSLYNGGIAEYGAPEGFAEVPKFTSKAKAIAALADLCAAGNLAISFDSGEAVIIDATPEASEGVTLTDPDKVDFAAATDTEPTVIPEGDTEGDEAPEGDTEGDEAPEGDGEGDDEAPEATAPVVAHGDGKGKVRAWGFVLGSDAWLEANPRGTPAREAYRKARRQAARAARKAKAAVADVE